MTHAATSAPVETPSPDWSDDLLLLAIAEGSGPQAAKHKPTADAAFTVFMNRWGRPMERLVEAWCAFPPALYVGADAVLLELWRKVFFRAETFDDQGLTGEALKRRVAGWLRQIARNVLRDEIAEHDRRKLCEIPDEALPSIVDRDPADVLDGDQDEKPIDRRLIALAECLQQLPERELDVLRTTADYLNADQETDSMPKHLCAALCERYRIPQATLRQVRKRAKDRLKKCAGPKLAAIDQGE